MFSAHSDSKILDTSAMCLSLLEFCLRLYLASDLRRLSDMRSSLTHQLDVRQSLCATVGDRTFAIAGARLWNSLPPADIIACDTVPRFRRELKTFLFRQSYPITHLLCFSLLWLAVYRGPCSFYFPGHVKNPQCNVM